MTSSDLNFVRFVSGHFCMYNLSKFVIINGNVSETATGKMQEM